MPWPPEIPPEQLELIRPVLEQLLADLRRHTADLPASAEPATDYAIEMEPAS